MPPWAIFLAFFNHLGRRLLVIVPKIVIPPIIQIFENVWSLTSQYLIRHPPIEVVMWMSRQRSYLASVYGAIIPEPLKCFSTHHCMANCILNFPSWELYSDLPQQIRLSLGRGDPELFLRFLPFFPQSAHLHCHYADLREYQYLAWRLSMYLRPHPCSALGRTWWNRRHSHIIVPFYSYLNLVHPKRRYLCAIYRCVLTILGIAVGQPAF